MSDRKLIEVCLGSVESVLAAGRGGADRVELCSDLFEGGLSPSIGTVRTALRLSSIPINAMMRPRGGDFCYSDVEFEVMKEEVRAFKAEGVNGIVFGILTEDGRVDMERSKEIISLARPLSVTFHRAFDMTYDLASSLEDLVSLGIDRVLTSGGEATVPEGAEVLRDLVRQAGDRIIVMPGCGLSERNFHRMSSPSPILMSPVSGQLSLSSDCGGWSPAVHRLHLCSVPCSSVSCRGRVVCRVHG